MIANVSPSIIFYEDTLNTLKYAERAMCCETNVYKKIVLDRIKSLDIMKTERIFGNGVFYGEMQGNCFLRKNFSSDFKNVIFLGKNVKNEKDFF